MPLIMVEEKQKQLPEEYLTDVANYIDSLIEAVSKKNLIQEREWHLHSQIYP